MEKRILLASRYFGLVDYKHELTIVNLTTQERKITKMRKDLKREKERFFNKKNEEDPEKVVKVVSSIKGNLRKYNINPKMPGFSLLSKSCYMYIMMDYDNIDDIYLLLGKITVIPVNKYGGICQEEQWMKESLRAVGIETGVFDFIKQISEQVKKELEIA